MPQSFGPEYLKLGKRSPGSALGYTWEREGQVLEVHVDHARTMIPASHGDIYEVTPSVDESERDESTVVTAAEPPKPKRPRPQKTVGADTGDLTQALGLSSVTTSTAKG